MAQRTFAVQTQDGQPAYLWSDDTHTLHFGQGFEDQVESTPEMLAEAVSVASLREVSASGDSDDKAKAIEAIAIRAANNPAVAGEEKFWSDVVTSVVGGALMSTWPSDDVVLKATEIADGLMVERRKRHGITEQGE
jgi:hypothetical protein